MYLSFSARILVYYSFIFCQNSIYFIFPDRCQRPEGDLQDLLEMSKNIPDLGVITAGPSKKGEFFQDFSHVELNLHFEFSFEYCGGTRAPTENYNIPK